MNVRNFALFLQEHGLEDFVGVPCSYLAPLINDAICQDSFIMANNEGDALAIASGISLASKDKYGIVLMQNSGLSNALSPLTSLNITFGIPVLGFVSLRGQRDDNNHNTDEPQHDLLGVITDKLLDVCGIPYMFLDADFEIAKKQVVEAKKYLKNYQSFFFIVRKGVFDAFDLEKQPSILQFKNKKSNDAIKYQPKYTRLEVLETLVPLLDQMIVLATTGKSGRELYEIQDRDNHFYMVGSMGCVGALGLGIALKSLKKIVCIDGDGALLMRLGALSTNAYYTKLIDRGNFCHILLDNQSHDSTGGQFTLSPFVNFTGIASSCGYEFVLQIQTLQELQKAIKDFENRKIGGATLIYITIKKGSKKNLGRPSISPFDVARRLQKALR